VAATTTGGGDYQDLTGYAAARREQTGPPPGFVMYGETFLAETVLRASSLLDLVDALDRGGLPANLGFLRDQLAPESWARFEVMFRDRDRPVDDGMIDQAVQVLIRQYTDRPTKESSSSASTRSKRGRSSKAGSSSAAPGLRSA
jgi:hypothetical protein